MNAAASPSLRPIALDPLPEQPFLSVLMVNYNYAAYIGEAIESVLAQRYPAFELVVADDCSTDDSCAVVERLAARDARVRLVRRERNGGMAAATNSAFAACRGQIICLLDSDDLFEPDKLAQVVAHFRAHPRRAFLVHPMMIIDAAGQPVQRIPFLTRFEEGWIAGRVVRRGGRWQAMPTSALAFRRELAERFFPVPEDQFRNNADGFFYLLAPLLTEVGGIDATLSRYRIHGQNFMLSARKDAAAIAKSADSLERQTNGANQRLAELGLGVATLDLDRNLEYRHYAFLDRSLRGEGRTRLTREYAALVLGLARDDVFSARQKLMRATMYAVTLALPAPARPWWLTRTLGYNRLKELFQISGRVGSAWGAMPRRRTRTG